MYMYFFSFNEKYLSFENTYRIISLQQFKFKYCCIFWIEAMFDNIITLADNVGWSYKNVRNKLGWSVFLIFNDCDISKTHVNVSLISLRKKSFL